MVRQGKVWTRKQGNIAYGQGRRGKLQFREVRKLVI